MSDIPEKVRQMPVSRIEWRHREDLFANDYNPNNVFKPEMQLLKTSLLEDGWALPLVTLPTGQIIDGFHRWSLSGEPKVYDLTDGFVPFVTLDITDPARMMASTIRFNRARGVHHVVKMADIVATLIAQGVSDKEISRLFGMEKEEIARLAARGNMLERAANDQMGKGWVPK